MYQDSSFYSNLNNENKLIILCSRTKTDTKIVSELIKILQMDLNWNYIIKFTFQHRLTTLMYWNLKEFEYIIPNNVFKILKDNFHNNVMKNLKMMGELLNLLKMFEKQGLQVIPYKGPLLSIQAYKHIGLRQFDDLDIFVHQNDVMEIKKILISCGFVPQFNFKGFKERKFLKTQREYKFKNQSKDINLEVQWKFSGLSFYSSESFGFEVSEIKEINNKKILSISPENMLLILCIHTSGHYWDRFSWICDISELIQANMIDWIYVLERAEKLRIKRILLINLTLVKDIFDVNFPNIILNELEEPIIMDLVLKVKNRLFMSDVNDIFLMAYIRFNICDSRYIGIQDILKIMFLPTNVEWEKSAFLSTLPLISYFYRLFHVLLNC